MAKFLRGRPSFTTGGETNAGDVVTGRQLLGVQGNDDPREFSLSGSSLVSPHGIPRDLSIYGHDKPAASVVQTSSVDASVSLATQGNVERGYAIQSRAIINDPRLSLLDIRGSERGHETQALINPCGCATCLGGVKDFDGYARQGHDGQDGSNALIPPQNHDEGTLSVTVGGFVSGVIDETGDQDFITVSLTAGETYSFYLYGSGGSPVTDTFLTLLGTDGTTVINEDDDGGVGLYSLITYTATTTGTYTLVAESFSNPGDPGLGNWTLAVHQQGADEAPSAPPSAVPATLGLNYGFISPAGTDEDVYSITLTAGFIYNFEVAGGADYNTDFLAVPAGEVDTIIRVYNSAGTLLFTNDDIDFPDDISSAIGFIPETSGTYYVEVDGYSGQSGGYVLDITQTDLSTLDPLDAIDWGGPTNVVDNSDTLLIYFATEGEVYDGVEDLGGWTPYLQQQALAAFQTYSQFANLTFAITTDQSEADFTLVTTTSDEYLAYFNPPGETNAGVGVFAVNGTGWDEDGSLGSMEPGGYGWITFIHEFGHGLGMAHPHDNGGGSEVIPGVTGPFGSYGIFDLNQGVYTTMSYNDGWQLHPDVDSNGFPVPDTLDYGYQGTPMAFDIALMQIKYGAVAANTGDTTYTLGDDNVAGTYYQAIWDTGGTDEIVYNGSADATIDLTAATLDYSATGAGVVSWVDGIFGGFTIANGVVIENASGGSGNDVLVGNSAENVLTGNEGNDSFVGGEGDDTFEAGDGTDTAVYFGNQADYTITAIAGGFTITDNNTADGDDGTDTFLDGEQVQFADGLVNLFDAPGNQAPELTGLATTVTFGEQAVNAAPQLIDSDVTLTDTDNNFDGGTLTVSGALAEDVIAIRNQGSLAGQVGVSGSNVTYGGVVIGTFTGGTGGTTLTVTFNAQASTLAVEAVIENLTYANASNSPTADRTLTLNVTDDEGASLIGSSYTPGPYVEQTGVSDPFAALPAFGAGPVFAFADVNNDGDLDILVGDQPGTLRYFDNNGGVYTEITGASNPFNGVVIPGPGTYSSPEAVDIDGDNDLDLIVGGAGAQGGQFVVFRNNGNGTWTNLVGAGVNPLNGFDIGNFSDPAGGDYDSDGDIDIIASNAAGNIFVFQNNGSGVFTQLAGAANPFNGVDVGSYASVTAGDIDGDGDLDVVAGTSTGTLVTFINNGSGLFTNAAPTGIFTTDFGSYSLPTLADIDGDGDADLVVADSSGGDSRVFLNTGSVTSTPAPTIQIHVDAQNDAPSGTSGSATILENTSYTFDAADFGFSDTLEGDDFAGVVITTLPGNGSLTLNNVAVSAGQFVTIADINGGLLVFTPDSEENGANYASFTFQVRDDGGTANGGIDTDPTPNTFSFEVTPDNFAPELTDLDSPVTFLENTVNAGPQLLDVDVTLTDDNGFAGGSLVVTGLLAEDVVGIFNEGTAAGQIGVSGSDVTYGGVVIGTVTGGTGPADLTVVFNGAVTTAAVEALIEHLTYANTSDTPTESRTLTIQVYDDEGLGLVSSSSFTEATGGDNPFADVLTPGNGSIPTFVDADGDGDLDLVVGNQDGTLQTFSNNGDGTYTELTGAANPFDGFDVGASGTYSAPAAIDLDGDGDQDLVVGSNYGDLVVLENDGVGGWTNAGFLSGVGVYAFSTPTVVDLDGDGLEDLVLGSLTGFLYGFINNGDGSFTELTGSNDPFLTTVVQYFSAPGFIDIDGDGDFDAVVGDYYGYLTVFTNDGGTFTQAVDQPFAGETFSSIPAPTFVDLDGDGDLDMVAGSFDGDIRTFINNGGSNQIVVNVTAEEDPPEAQDDAFVITENQTISGNLFADNGYGEDEPGSEPLAISAVNGSPSNVGVQITLASGALLLVNSDGTFTYNPNGVFLPTPTADSGAVNTPANDSFTYTAAGGNTVTVTFTLTGQDTDDYLLGSVNGDTLFGGAGADTMVGLAGDDAYFVDNAGDVVTEAAGEGFDAVYTSVDYTLTAGSEVEWLSAISQASTAALNLTGNATSQYLLGNDGTNFLSGGGGDDIMIGYDGNDAYVVDSASDVVVEQAGQGFDAVYASISYTLAPNASIEWLSAADNAATVAISLTGNNLANYVIGNAGANVLDGGAGADLLYGLGGDDTYFVDNLADQLFEGVGNGFDAVYATVNNYVLAAGQEVEWLSTADTGSGASFNLTGNELAQYLIGNAGTNVLNGGGGADILIGLGGNDYYYVTTGAVVIEAAGGGYDSILASSSYVLNAGSEVEFLGTTDSTGTTAIDLTGNELDNVIYGNAGANVLDGKGGNDMLLGLAGADTFAFTSALGANNVDIVFGFEHGVDKIALDDAIFTAIGGLGALNANAFVTGSAAADASDRIIYNSATGQLYYDADGTGAGAAVLFANLSPGLNLTASDFQVI